MKLIFLDIDGVLNSEETKFVFSRTLFNRLGRILAETGAKLIITSGWRGYNVEDTILNLTNTEDPSVGNNPFPFGPWVVYVTPRSGDTRGGELNASLICAPFRCHMEIDTWIIIDDEDFDYDKRQLSHLVKTDPSIGLSDADVALAIQMLNEPETIKECLEIQEP